MLTRAFCLAKAAECEAAAAQRRDEALRYEWLHTAGEWRVMAMIMADEPPAPVDGPPLRVVWTRPA